MLLLLRPPFKYDKVLISLNYKLIDSSRFIMKPCGARVPQNLSCLYHLMRILKTKINIIATHCHQEKFIPDDAITVHLDECQYILSRVKNTKRSL